MFEGTHNVIQGRRTEP